MNPKPLYTLGGALGVLVVALSFSQFSGHNSPFLAKKIANSSTIEKKGQNAFGPLATLVSLDAATPVPAPASEMASMATDQAARNAAPTAPIAAMSSKMVAPGMGGDASRIVAPDMFQPYTYVYKGETLELSETTRDVFKKIRSTNLADFSTVKDLNLDLINLNSFAGSKLRSFELVDERDHGYTVTVNLGDSAISINQNWSVWSKCASGICPTPPPFTRDQAMTPEALIALSNEFLKVHGISTSQYGSPEIQDSFSPIYLMRPMADGGGDGYVSEIATVIYPLQLGGSKVHELNGGPIGLQVSIDQREKKVTSVWNLQAERYESSGYEAETDFGRIVKVAEASGTNWYQPEAKKPVEIKLGTPSISYARTWKSSADGQESFELYVPVYIFPVINAPTTIYPYYNKFVMVPLIKDLINSPEKPQPMPLPMPIDSEPTALPVEKPMLR